MSSLLRAPLPSRLMLHTTNILWAAWIRGWGREAAAVRWLLPEGGDTPLTLSHFRRGGPAEDHALSRLGDLPGPILLMLPTNIAVAVRRELDNQDGLRVGREAVADGALLALSQLGNADGCPWDALVPHLDGVLTYMTTPREDARPE